MKRNQETIGILGYGWLGSALARVMQQTDFMVKASKTKWPKEGSENNVEPYTLQLTEENIEGDLSFFHDLDQLLVFLPPSQKKTGFSLLAVLEVLYEHITQTDVKRVIFTSSTSVYGSQSGKLTENTPPKPETKNGKTLLQCEQFIEKQNLPYLIFRLGGLIGFDRHPIYQLQNKIIPNPDGYINFIHQTDAVNVLLRALENYTLRGVYNTVSPYHPKRRDYYTALCKTKGLPMPQFTDEPAIERIIASEKLEREFNYSFMVNNLLI